MRQPPPPAILIAWSAQEKTWRATAIVSSDPAPITIAGPSTSVGSSPTGALDTLLTRRFGILADEDCPATVVTIAVDQEFG